MPDRSSPSPQPQWGPASTHQAASRRPAGSSTQATSEAAPPSAPPRRSGASPFPSPFPGPATRTTTQPEAAPSSVPASDEPRWSNSPPTKARPARTRPAGNGRGFHVRKKWILLGALVLVAALIAYPFLLVNRAMAAVHRVDALPASTLGDSPGTNFLVVGSDSRVGTNLGDKNEQQSARSDTIMLLHVPDSGDASLVSIPRDSYVPVPGHKRNKINAAFSLGGPQLLVETVEGVTGVKIDRYVSTDLEGLTQVVNAVGGVTLCPVRTMVDPQADLNVKKGCQTMNGATALGYARARHSDPEGDLGRVKRQRELLSAIMHKAATPATVLNPFNAFPLASAGGGALTVDNDASSTDVYSFVMGMRSVSSGGLSLTVPVSNPSLRTNAGLAVQWDHDKAMALFTAIKNDDNNAIKQFAGK